MNIQFRPRFEPPKTPPTQPESKVFNYNPQDRQVLGDQPLEVSDVVSRDGKPETDGVKLANKTAVFDALGRLRDIKDDPDFKLEPKADGSYNYADGEDKHTAANVFGGAAATVAKYNQVYSDLTGKKVEWAFDSKQLGLSPETGNWPNAFYARELGGVHFFDHKTTSTGDSGEVVSHEVGHAILDGVRPNYFDGVGAETGAFHEAFGDILAFLMTLTNDQAAEKLVADTGGDLSAHRNFLSDMGEDFGAALGRAKGGIRNSFNTFKYQDPATLPERGSETQLGHEVHDFSRLWSGAFYDVLDGIADANRAEGMSPKEALKAAGEEGWKLLIGQMENSPSGSETTFKKMAAALMEGDKQFNGGKRQEIIGDIMVRRELLTREQASNVFKSSGPAYSGDVVSKEVTLGGDFGMLAGVKVETLVDQPIFKAFAQSDDEIAHEVQKGVRLMMDRDQILFSDSTPTLGELFKPNGEAYSAYVSTNEQGQKELHRVPLVVCDHGDHGHDHHHHH